MHGLTCDLCGDTLLIDSDVRYRVRIDVFAAWDPLEVTRADLERDLEGEMAALLRQMEAMDPRELQDQVFRRVEYDLCPPCQRRFLADPLGVGRRRAVAAEAERGEDGSGARDGSDAGQGATDDMTDDARDDTGNTGAGDAGSSEDR